MTIERPMFSESWHRIADMRCRLRTGVHVVRQRYRGSVWHVVQDPTANQFFRLNQAAYTMLGLLDGRRTVAEAWRLASERWGDLAPTQVEAVQLLGQLYTSNLLTSDASGDPLAVLNRRQQRVAREVKSHLTNLLFLRIPLFDPDALLTRWRPMVGWLFTPLGLALWVVLLCVGGVHLIGRESELASAFAGVLATDNLPYLYAVFVGIKLVHELAHAFACKCFGFAESGARPDAGAVRSMGIMLMVLMPVPYVDASSSWAFRSKPHRILVASAGMMAELALASIAAVIWSRSAEGGLVHALAFNAIVTASVSTLLLNGNPLLRYDGYFILSEAIEIPNLAQRSNHFVQYLVKKYLWRMPRLPSPASTRGETAWFAIYAPSSFLYRIVVFAGILLFIAQQWFIIGIAFALFGLLTWLVLPASRFARYLLTSAELARVRARAIVTTGVAICAAVGVIGIVPFPDHVRADGVVEPVSLAIVHAGADGFVSSTLRSGSSVRAGSSTLIASDNLELTSRTRELSAEISRLAISHRMALNDEPARALQFQSQLRAVRQQLEYAHRDVTSLVAISQLDGTWVCAQDESLPGGFVQRGAAIGLVADLNTLMVRAVATQDVAGRLVQAGPSLAQVRVKGRAAQLLNGSVSSILPAGQEHLPSRALGFRAGGSVETDPGDQRDERTKQQFFEIRIALDHGATVLPGQRVVARFRLPDRPLAAQAWHELEQVFQRRFRI